jgi:hypothetical protein
MTIRSSSTKQALLFGQAICCYTATAANQLLAKLLRSTGREILKAVPLLPLWILLQLLIRPLCLSTIAFEIESPRPVPLSCLVVKKGSKIFL